MKVMKGEAARWFNRGLLYTAITLAACVSFISGPHASAQQPSSASIVGRWRSLETSKGGIGYVWEFRADGTVDFSASAVVEMRWRIEGNQLILPPATTDGPEQKATLKWLGDNKLRLETEWSGSELERVGDRSDPVNPIVGEWLGKSETGGEARYLFYARGKVLLVIPFAFQHGSYTISGSKLHLKLSGLPPESIFEVADNLLTFPAPKGGQDAHYARY